MHLGYHELRNMLTKFKEERDKRKAQAAPPPVPSSSGGSVAGRGGEHRPSRDDHRDRERDRDRDRGYSERHSSSRYEYVDLYLLPVGVAHKDPQRSSPGSLEVTTKAVLRCIWLVKASKRIFIALLSISWG
jgi:hypothetical protein